MSTPRGPGTALEAAAADLGAALELASSRAGAAGWDGAAARAAAERWEGLAGRGRALVAALAGAAGVLDRGLADLAGGADGGAAHAGLGGQGPGSGAPGDTSPDRVARAVTADARLAAALDAIAPLPAPAGRPGSLDPEAVARWWAGLAPEAREALVRDRPELVGGLDGVPARDRDRSNRARLRVARETAEADRDAALLRLVGGGSPADLARIGVRLADVQRRLARLTAVAAAAGRPGRALLAIESDGGGVRAAVAQGDLDTARHVGVFTPGFTADVRDLDGRLDELGSVGAAAGPDTAMVAWYGYDAPRWTGVADPRRSVLTDTAARDGAVRLAGFLGGLDAARTDDAHVTAIGHSYGSLTTASAVSAARGVDDAVYLGSPGLGSGPPGPAGHAWVAEAAGDPVADAGWFGPDPNRLPGVTGLSAREAVRADGTVTTASWGHDEYLRPGTTSAQGVAAVVAGRGGDAVVDRGVGAGDRLRELLGGPAR